jgi:hypothetical protein
MSSKVKSPPSDSPEARVMIDDICRRISEGETLNVICEDQADFGYPSASCFRDWVVKDTPVGIGAQYARARELQFDAISEQIIQHSDKALIGVRTKETIEHGLETTTGDNVDRARLMVDSRKWLLSKLAPKKYGDRTQTEITGADGGPLVVRWEK